MDAKTRALIEAKAVEQCKARKPLDWTVEETEAFKAGAEEMEALMLEREEKLVAVLEALRPEAEAIVNDSHPDCGVCAPYKLLLETLAEHHAAKGNQMTDVENTEQETSGDFLSRVGMDGAKWASEFIKIKRGKIIGKEFDEGDALGWFCNAIMAGYDRGVDWRNQNPKPPAESDEKLPAFGTLALSVERTNPLEWATAAVKAGYDLARANDPRVSELVEALDVALELASTPERNQDERWNEKREWCESVSKKWEGRG